MLFTLEDLEKIEKEGKGNISDGYHTFNELYHHRNGLFMLVCNSHKNISWKSKLHSNGTMFEGYFIAGIETPKGQATYHMELKYFDKFKVKEYEKAPGYDGHTSNDAISRIIEMAENMT